MIYTLRTPREKFRMYARGMSNREISAHMKEIYGVSVSAEFISRVTDDVLEDVRTWRSRPLQDFYPVVFFDALRVKVKSGNTITPKALYLALAVKADGSREVLGMWLSDNEGAAYWTSVFNEIRARGCSDILIAVTDGLKGMTKAIETVYPKTMHQTCIVHLLRNSTPEFGRFRQTKSSQLFDYQRVQSFFKLLSCVHARACL